MYKLISTIISLPVLAYIFLGIYIDSEFGEAHLFIKHRPYPQLIFASPQGEADRSYTPGKEGYLTPEMEQEQTIFEEFVYKNRGYKRSIKIL